jgi:hypothetical protein
LVVAYIINNYRYLFSISAKASDTYTEKKPHPYFSVNSIHVYNFYYLFYAQ